MLFWILEVFFLFFFSLIVSKHYMEKFAGVFAEMFSMINDN